MGIKHGHAGGKASAEYESWGHMIQRMTNPNCKSYSDYGGRGLTLDPSWRKFENFLRDMGLKPSPRHSIERRDNSAGYTSSNCYWGTATEQNRNTRRNRFITHEGRTQCLSAWAEELGISSATLLYRMKRGWSVKRTLTTPLQSPVLAARAALRARWGALTRFKD